MCSVEGIQCAFHRMGCDAIIARKDKERHNKEMMQKHLRLATWGLKVAKEEISQLQTFVVLLGLVGFSIMQWLVSK